MTAAPNAPIDPNKHVSDYLAYYIAFQHPPRYAVMLNGKWGAGKTFQVKKIVGALLNAQKKRYVLVSLYGLKTPQEIDDAMVTALYPWTDNGGVRIATSVGRAILKHAKIDLPALKSGDIINRMSADVFIFDDLERCSMAVTDALGYINQLVERDGCKVIVLANEKEISDQPAYLIGKEKLIGKTLEVEPDFKAAFNKFLKEILDEATKSFYSHHQTEIQIIYEQSSSKNLRILQQTLWDFERVYSTTCERHRTRTDAMNHILRLFLAIAFEFKAGNFNSDDLEMRSTQSMFGILRDDDNVSVFRSAKEKYFGLYIYDTTLSDQIISDILVRGVVDKVAIGQSLDASSWFVSANEPSWRTVWYSSERSDQTVEAAATKMLAEFENRHYLLAGEILHVFGQMLWLASIGFSGRDRVQTVVECKSYVDELRGQGKLELPLEAYLDNIRHGSFGGLGFRENETSEFRALWVYLDEQRALAEKDQFSDQATSLMSLMSDDPDSFVQQIAYKVEAVAPFANKPVLAAADPKIFAGRMISLDPLAFREVLLGLSSRYDMAKLAENGALSGERAWAENLEAALLEKAAELKPFAKERISKMVEWTLGKELKELREAEAQRSLD